MTGRGQPLAVIDTNVFVSGFLRRGGNANRLLELLYNHAFVHITTQELITELDEVLRRPVFRSERYGVRESQVATFLAFIARHSVIVSPSLAPPVQSRDPKDDKFLCAAFGGNADYLVTGDNDLLVLRDDTRLGDLRIITLSEFLAELSPHE
jgi:putative PIN family toxin of toxin-antitoxin system